MAAAKRAAELFARATEWWRTPEIQRARRAFLDRFGLAARDWRRQWARYLREVARP
jgi:hypothetical protein